jgi:hypothetical protein
MHCYAIPPFGDTIEIFDIPKWDFDWQLAYQFRQPIHLPFGTRIYADAVYDNTSNNPHNPSNPPVNVAAGEATTDEMFLIFFSYLLYEAGDENMVFGDAPLLSNECAGVVGVEENPKPDFMILPNPADQHMLIRTSWTDYTVTLLDMFGRVLLTGKQLTEIYTGLLTEGMYIISIHHAGDQHVEKVMIAH